MTKREKQRLLRAFAVAYELAYRRGFHHGFVALPSNRSGVPYGVPPAELDGSGVPLPATPHRAS
jgi:hypothetical protein